jgi:outer membrane protein assembly factor BamB
MRRLLLLLALVFVSPLEAQPGGRFNVRPRQIELEPEPREVVPEFQEDENSFRHQAAPIAASIGLLGGASLVPPPAVAADVAGRLWGPRMSEAVDEYARQLAEEKSILLEPAADDKAEITTVRDLHRMLQQRISRLPPPMVDRYRRRVEVEAQQLLREAASTRSQAPLLRLVRDYFNSGPTETALAILGDTAFERGRFDDALAWWRLLAPLPSRRGSGALVYPAGALDRDRVVAKEILALIFLDRFAEAERELALFEQTSADAHGMFAGDDDRYVATLHRWLARRRAESTLEEPDAAWPTFAGSPTGNRVLRKPPSDRLWIDGPTWRAPLAADKAPTAVRLSAARALSVSATPVHPIIALGQVIFADGFSIESRDLATGALRFRNSVQVEGKGELDETRGTSLSAGNGIVCVRFGFAGQGRTLLGLDLTKAGLARWKIEIPQADRTAFASDPLVQGDRVYIVKQTAGDRKTTLTLDAMDLATGTVVWSTRLADVETHDGSPSRAPLLLADESTIVVVSHAGFVIACDRTSGGRQWAIRYPSAEVAGSPRDMAAGLIADGRLYAAPADGTGLFAADLSTGQVLWERRWLQAPTDVVADPPLVSEVVQLFGVVDGRLLFTDRGRLTALRAATGTTVWQQPGIGKLPGQGRGLIAGSWVFWPTADPQVSWRAVTHEAGELRSPEATPEYFEPTTLRNLPAGNVIFGEGCLVIAGSRELVAFVPTELRLEKLKRDARQSKVKPETLGLLALAQRAAGQTDAATLADLWSRVPFYEKADWQKLLDQRRTGLPQRPKRTARAPMSTASESAAPTSPNPAAPKPALGLVERAWGPVAGFAPRIEPAPGDWLIVVDSGDLVLVDSRTGEPRWRRPWKQPLLWLGRAGAVVVAAGSDSIEAFAVADGRPVWRRRAPAEEPGRWAFVDGEPRELRSRDRFIDFAPGPDETLRCAVGPGHREFAVALRTGSAVDVGGDARVGVEALEAAPAASFADQARRLLTYRGGTVRAGDAGSLEFRLPTGDSLFEPDWPTSLTGEAADLLLGTDAFLALVPRNQGSELACHGWDPPRLRWVRPSEEMGGGFDVRAAAIDERAVYYAQRGQLVARAMWSGAVLWQRPLPANPGPWQVDRYGNMLVVWPRSAAGVPFLAPTEMPLLTPVALAFGRRGIGSLPILLVEPADGRVQQRIDVPHDGGPAIVWAQGSNLYATAGAQVTAYRTSR